jgi:hypothetical protein
MDDREVPRMHRYGESKTTRTMKVTARDFQFGTQRISGPLIFVEQRANPKKTAVFHGSRSTAVGGGPKAAQRMSTQHAGTRKAYELASMGDYIEPANRRSAHGVGSEPLPVTPSVTVQIGTAGSRELGPPEARNSG